MINEAYWTSEASAKPPGCEPGGVSSQGRGGDARGIKPSELGGVLQDAHYREQDYADGENGHGHNAKGEQGPHGQFPQWPPNVDQGNGCEPGGVRRG